MTTSERKLVQAQQRRAHAIWALQYYKLRAAAEWNWTYRRVLCEYPTFQNGRMERKMQTTPSSPEQLRAWSIALQRRMGLVKPAKAA